MRIALTEFLTVDGISQGPGSPDEDTSDGFTRGGCLVPRMQTNQRRTPGRVPRRNGPALTTPTRPRPITQIRRLSPTERGAWTATSSAPRIKSLASVCHGVAQCGAAVEDPSARAGAFHQAGIP